MALSGQLNTTDYNGRYLTLNWRVSNSEADRIATNKSVLVWELVGADDGTVIVGYHKAGNFKVVIAGVTVFTSATRIELYTGTVVASGEITLTHNTDGTKSFDAYVEAGIYYSAVNCSGSGSFTLDTIPRVSELTASNGTLGISQTLVIDRKASTFKHRLTYKCGSVSAYIAGSETTYTSETSITWTPPISLAAQNTTGTSVSITLTLYTYASDGTHLGTVTKVIACVIPASVKPSCTLTLVDATGLDTTYGAPVQGLSKIQITVKATTAQGSPIALYSIDANGVYYPAEKATTDVLTDSGAFTVNATVKDQRGRTGSATDSLDVLAYSPPNVSKLTVHRCNADGAENDQGEYVLVVFSAAVTDLNGKNSAAYALKYKASGAMTFTQVDFTGLNNMYTVTDASYIFHADSNNSYDVEVTATDNHGAATRATSASTAFTLLNWNKNGNGMGVGKVSERENAVEFALSIYDKNDDEICGLQYLVNLFYPVGSITLRYDHINPGTIYGGTWTRITDAFLFACPSGSTSIDGSKMQLPITFEGDDYLNYMFVSMWRRTA